MIRHAIKEAPEPPEKIMVLEHIDREVKVKNEKNGSILLLLDLKDAERMTVAGMDPENDDDLFQYANHLLGNQFSDFYVK